MANSITSDFRQHRPYHENAECLYNSNEEALVLTAETADDPDGTDFFRAFENMLIEHGGGFDKVMEIVFITKFEREDKPKEYLEKILANFS